MSEALRLAPSRASSRNAEVRDLVLSTGKFDPDVWHVMEERDNALIANEILNGAGSNKFVYRFDIGNKEVSGISVVGARHLASHYGGIKHRIIATVEKTGSLFRYVSYPNDGAPMRVSAESVHELAHEPDYAMTVVEIADVKRGNTVQVERAEFRWESRRDGTMYERPNYATIAASKAYRNGVLALIPQDVQIEWKAIQLKLGRDDTITGSVLEEKRAAILRFAAGKGIGVDRRQLDTLMLDQIAGLSDAARGGGVDQFRMSAEALGLLLPDRTAVPLDAPPPRKSKPAPAVPAAAPKPNEPPFEAFLLDEHGEPQADPNGTLTVYNDPLRFARALSHAWNQSKNREAITAHNADGIADARERSPQAAAMLDALVVVPDEPMLVAVPKTPKGSVHVPNYRAALAARLATIRNAEEMSDFAAANRENIVSLPQTGRLQCVGAVAARCAELGVPTPVFQAADPSQQQPTEDADLKRAVQMEADIDACGDADSLMAFGISVATTTVLARWGRDRPELAERVKAYAAARHAAITGKAK